jgi:hypothetical protein
MVTKKSTKKTSAKKTTQRKSTSHQSIEEAVEKGIERGIQNTAQGFIKKHHACCSSSKDLSCKDTAGWMYFLGIVGAAVYYISAATGFWSGVLGVLKAIIWPAMLVFKLLGL